MFMTHESNENNNPLKPAQKIAIGLEKSRTGSRTRAWKSEKKAHRFGALP